MSEEQEYSARPLEGGGLVLEGPPWPEGAGETWTVKRLGDQRFLLQPIVGNAAAQLSQAGLASCPTTLFVDFLAALSQNAWSGAVQVVGESTLKRIFFDRGAIVFATSNLIDDRLGEIIYRAGLISINDWVDAAAGVDRNTKFGQALLKRGDLTNPDLWNILKVQVLEILKSVFMEGQVFFELDVDAKAPTQVVFLETTIETLEQCHGYGVAFRDFASRLDADSRITVLCERDDPRRPESGTFEADILDMIEAESDFDALIASSKVSKNYTLSSIMRLMQEGFLHIEMHQAPHDEATGVDHDRLRVWIHTFHTVLKLAKTAFSQHRIAFPLADLHSFCKGLDDKLARSVYLDAGGALASESIRSMLVQTRERPRRASGFASRLKALSRFIHQVAGDSLPPGTTAEIRSVLSSPLT